MENFRRDLICAVLRRSRAWDFYGDEVVDVELVLQTS